MINDNVGRRGGWLDPGDIATPSAELLESGGDP